MADEMVERVKGSVDILEVVGDAVALTKRGRNYWGLCPFHQEKTPSFSVSPQRQSWHCFGCGKGGDVFSFVMLREGLSFPEALEQLARRGGVALPTRRRASPDLYGLMERALELYRQELTATRGAAAQGYLKRRNITMADAARFELGWAPPSWDFLLQRLGAEGVPLAMLRQAGLIVDGDRGSYDRFRGRIIFPIRNVAGRVIAFGGRLIDGEGAKYLNSPEGPLYNKKNHLYLLDRAKGTIREKDRSILVEGYMDALRLHLQGYGEAVASLGTALTEDQAALLRRFSSRCYICYDSDAAGQAATLRGMYLLQSAGLSVFVVSLPEGKDPDEVLQLHGGPALFEKALEEALPLVRHHIGLFRQAARSQGEARAADELLQGLAQLSALELAPYLQELAQALALADYQLMEELNRRRSRSREGQERRAVERPAGEKSPAPDQQEAALIYLLWTSRRLRLSHSAAEVVPWFQSSAMQSLAAAVLSGESPSALEQRWLEMGETLPLAAIAAGGAYCETLPGDGQEKWELLCKSLENKRRRLRYNELRLKMLRREATTEELQQYLHLAQELKGGAQM